jgi:hypothetical protein
MGMLDMYHAIELSKDNRKRAEKLTDEAADLKRRATQLEKRYAKLLRTHFDGEVAPFALAFGQLKNCDLEDVDVLGRVPAVNALPVDTRKVSLGAVQGLVTVAGGAAAGTGAAALTFAAVSALATASTGTAIAGLSGAAATSATLAWLGGGSVAAGGMGVAGGMAVLAGVVAVPLILAAGGFLWWKGAKELDKQKAVAAELKRAKASLKRDKAVLDGVDDRIKQAKLLLKKLGTQILPLNDWLADLVTQNNDYRTYTEEQKQRLAVQVSLVMAMTAILSAPLVVTVRPNRGASTTAVNPDFIDRLDEVDRMLSELDLEA